MLLSNNENIKGMYQWLLQRGYEVKLYHDPLTLEVVEQFAPELVISYNYRHIIKGDVIRYMENAIINLHISFLPWNKGADPNIWSFIDDTPKGVTIHRLEEGLDTGRIIWQRELQFDEDAETLSSTYQKLNEEIVKLLMEHWENLEAGDYPLREQEGEGSYHRKSDLQRLLKGREIDFGMTITQFKAMLAE